MNAILISLLWPFFLVSTGQISSMVDGPVIERREDFGIVIRVEVEFGRKSRGCSDFGVCRFNSDASIMGVLEGNRAIAEATAENGVITNITFLQASMNASTIKTYFSGDQFVVGEKFSTVITYEGKQYKLNLKAGKFKLAKTPQGWSWGMSNT